MNEESIIESIKDFFNILRMYERKSRFFHKRTEEIINKGTSDPKWYILWGEVFKEADKEYPRT